MGGFTTFEEELRRSGRLVYTNVGWSMSPLLREGRDVMVIEPCDPRSLKPYEAVLFRRPGVQGRGAYVLHRILKRLKDGSYWIVGDNCTCGEFVMPEQILGRLTAVQRNGKLVQFEDWKYRAYVYLWCAPYPVRFFILHISRFVRRSFGRLKRELLRLIRKH